MMTRAEALRKCLIVFDALRRVSSKGNAGLEPLQGAEESFRTDSEICQVLREWLREMEAGTASMKLPELDPRRTYTMEQMLGKNPLMTQETIEAARAVDEARDKLIEKYASRGLEVPNGPLEPDVPKVVDLREWQRIAAERPPERLDFDE